MHKLVIFKFLRRFELVTVIFNKSWILNLLFNVCAHRKCEKKYSNDLFIICCAIFCLRVNRSMKSIYYVLNFLQESFSPRISHGITICVHGGISNKINTKNYHVLHNRLVNYLAFSLSTQKISFFFHFRSKNIFFFKNKTCWIYLQRTSRGKIALVLTYNESPPWKLFSIIIFLFSSSMLR